MCCIFTCCGWMIDLIQRVWTFAMSCVISSAVCCVCFTSSLSGVALGYNYSLAEYIDMKETNVSVYMKRGVFDDAIVDDMHWRRSGHQPVAGHIGEDNLLTGAPEGGEMPLRSGRRLDNSVYEADDRNKFEGSLLKLTAKAPYDGSTASHHTDDNQIINAMSDFTEDSVNLMKAVQSIQNMRKSAQGSGGLPVPMQMHSATLADPLQFHPFHPSPVGVDGRRWMGTPPNIVSNYPLRAPDGRMWMGTPQNSVSNNPMYAADGRRWMGNQQNNIPNNPLREAVPRFPLRESFAVPKLESLEPDNNDYFDSTDKPTLPMAITVRGPIRPTRPSTKTWPTHTARKVFVSMEETARSKDVTVDAAIDAFKEKLMLDQFDTPDIKVDKLPKTKDSKKSEDMYDYEARGLPVRRRRNVPISGVKSTYFTNRLQISNKHSETANVASTITRRNDKHVTTTTDNNDSNNNYLNNLSRYYLINKLLNFFTGKFDKNASKNNAKNETNADIKTDVTGTFDAFKLLPVEVTRKELLTKILQSRFLS